jgi:UDP-N-acetylglucosamine 4,6-dehydratase/UDP-glucose 4-epimerase
LLKAYSVQDLKTALEELLHPVGEEIISIRQGEKMHEALLNPDEMRYTWEVDNKFIVFDRLIIEDEIKKIYPGIKKISTSHTVSSNFAEKMSIKEIKEKIIESKILDQYKKELSR